MEKTIFGVETPCKSSLASVDLLLLLLFDPEDADGTLFQNVWLSPNYTALQFRVRCALSNSEIFLQY
jgi:hypothetical protein